MAERWVCSVCGVEHEGVPLDWGFDAPAYWDEERDGGDGYLNSDLCFVRHADGDHRFVRGVIDIPIIDATDGERFGIGAWVSLSERNFDWYNDHFDADEAEQGKPWFGWLSNSIPVYPDTLSLKTDVILQGDGYRPRIRVEPTDHPLARDQHNGITFAAARDLSARWQHVLQG